MTFEEVLDQALEMLRRRGRVTYRALQRQFGLDDAYLADLKAEIIEAQRLAVDENGTVLVHCHVCKDQEKVLRALAHDAMALRVQRRDQGREGRQVRAHPPAEPEGVHGGAGRRKRLCSERSKGTMVWVRSLSTSSKTASPARLVRNRHALP